MCLEAQDLKKSYCWVHHQEATKVKPWNLWNLGLSRPAATSKHFFQPWMCCFSYTVYNGMKLLGKKMHCHTVFKFSYEQPCGKRCPTNTRKQTGIPHPLLRQAWDKETTVKRERMGERTDEKNPWTLWSTGEVSLWDGVGPGCLTSAWRSWEEYIVFQSQ